MNYQFAHDFDYLVNLILPRKIEIYKSAINAVFAVFLIF